MTVETFTPAAMVFFLTSGVAIAGVIAARSKTHRKRSRRALAVHLRMESAWKNARIRMYLPGPIGPSYVGSTKYSTPVVERIKPQQTGISFDI
jgi:hypothetical protein